MNSYDHFIYQITRIGNHIYIYIYIYIYIWIHGIYGFMVFAPSRGSRAAPPERSRVAEVPDWNARAVTRRNPARRQSR